MAGVASEAVLHALLAALLGEALLRVWGASLELRMRVRLLAVAAPLLATPAFELLVPGRHAPAFVEGWGLLDAARWSEVTLLGLGPRWLWVPVAGASLLLLGLDLVPWVRDRGVRHPEVPCPEPLAALVARLAGGLGVAPPEVVVVEAPGALLFCRGVRRPRVVLSTATLARLDQRELEGALAHELSHLAQGDVLLGWGLLAVRVLQAFNPVVQVLARAVALDAEERADARAAALTGRPAALASALVSMFKASGGLAGTSEVLLGAALARALEAHIADRARLLLAPPAPRSRGLDAVRLASAGAAILGLLFLVT